MARVLCQLGSNTDVARVLCLSSSNTDVARVLCLPESNTDVACVLCLSGSNTDMTNTDQTQIWLVFCIYQDQTQMWPVFCVYQDQTQMWPVFSVVSEILFSQVSSIPVYRGFDRNASVVRLVDRLWMLLLSQQAFFSTQRVKPC